MVGEDKVIMSVKELRRLSVIHQVMEKKSTQVKAGALLGLTARQIRRIIERVQQEGDHGLAHRSRGKRSNRPIAERSRRRPCGCMRSGMGILGRRWRRRNWKSGRGSRSATRRCGYGYWKQGSPF